MTLPNFGFAWSAPLELGFGDLIVCVLAAPTKPLHVHRVVAELEETRIPLAAHKGDPASESEE